MRPRIARCHVLIQLVGPQTYAAQGAIWEVNCAKEENVPAFGVWISKTARGPVPSCFAASSVIDWTWDGVGEMIKRIAKKG